jgi:hypothetical protein
MRVTCADGEHHRDARGPRPLHNSIAVLIELGAVDMAMRVN